MARWNIFRRPLLAGTVGLGAAAVTGAAGRAAAGPALIARKEMAVQVIDFGWRRELSFDSAGPDGAITNEIYTLETAADHVRFRFQNGLAAPWSIGGATYAPTALAQNDPVDASGAPCRLLPVTFGNGGADLALADQPPAGAAPTSLTLPPANNGGAFQKDGYQFRGKPNIVFSDWMPFAGVARADGSPGNLVMLRVWTPSPEFTGVRPTRIGGHSLFQGTPARPWRSFAAAAGPDAATMLTATGFPAPEPQQIGSGLCCGVQAIGPQPGLTLLSVGDSVLMGGGEAQGYLGAIKRAADLMSSPQLPVSHIGSAIFGCPSKAFFYAGREALRTNKVSCAFIQVWTGNDPHTMEAAEACFQNALAFAEECRAQGTVPVFMTPGPPRDPDPHPELAAIHHVTMAKLRVLAARGQPLLDLYKLLGDGARNDAATTRRPNLIAFDNVHANSAGDTLLANGAVALLKTMSIVQG